MTKITLLLFLLFLPLASLGEGVPADLRCDIEPLSQEPSNWSQYTNIEDLENQLLNKIELEEYNIVIICLLQQYESPGHGVFGLVDWDERRIAEIELKKFTNNEDQLFTAYGKGLTEQKAPLGKWRAKDDSTINSWLLPYLTADLREVLENGTNNLIDSKQKFSANIQGIF